MTEHPQSKSVRTVCQSVVPRQNQRSAIVPGAIRIRISLAVRFERPQFAADEAPPSPLELKRKLPTQPSKILVFSFSDPAWPDGV